MTYFPWPTSWGFRPRFDDHSALADLSFTNRSAITTIKSLRRALHYILAARIY